MFLPRAKAIKEAEAGLQQPAHLYVIMDSKEGHVGPSILPESEAVAFC